MASKVYFANLRARNARENRISKVNRLFEAAGFKDLINEKDLTAIKLHFGERGNDGFINPVYVRQVVEGIKQSGGKPFLTDTNTLYSGSRANAVDHLITAVEHGFDYAVVGAPLIIADGLLSKNSVEIEIGKKHFNHVKIAGDIAMADSMIVLSHFKGHDEAGFGGAIKNLAMGCAPASGKQQQHSTIKPSVNHDKCIGCAKCFSVCPASAVKLENRKSNIMKDVCLGCGECITVCLPKAIAPNWEHDMRPFMERLTEHAYGAVFNKKNRVGYINFLINITPSCDCCGWSDTAIVPDIGILASTDPVAIDKASLDLVNQQVGFQNSMLVCNHGHGEDKFRGLRKDVDGTIQLNYGEEIGLGSTNYELIQI